MTLPILVDAHCHLDFPDFDDERSAVIDRARAAGVTRMVTICTKLPNAPRVAAIADAYDGVFWAAGVHPMSVGEHAPVTVEELVTLAQHPKFVGIGETGLDYHYTAETKAAQQDSLRLHIEACRQTKLPLIIHARDADDDMAHILREEYDAGKYTCMMHCFSSTRALAEAALDMDFYLSMSGIAAFPKSKELRDIFKDAPLDRILTETDSPYLAPPPFRGRRNEPAYTAHTAQVGADTFELSLDDFAKATSANFDRLFWKAA
ncbi:TatD DNase family protein [Loktanella salsilacus]|uniref:TatD DNase family protein n=1 Tax=Loktanella salsilacus TaxID=195913 RepID=A0A1I4FV14_9RHOB|nr:TatD family hydrolase [Loktanella salsilacus]SFL21675.1 TatD DNase family protein [Loktanella salsilacus]